MRAELLGDPLRVRPDAEADRAGDEREARCDEPRERQRFRLELLAGEERREDRRAEDRPEHGAEEDVRDPACAALRRVHVAGGGAREQRDAACRARQRHAGDHDGGRAGARRERDERAAERRDHEADGDHRDAAEVIHRPPSRQRGEPGRREEDRRAEPEQPLDPRDLHERDRVHRGRELEEARVHRERRGEQDRVALDVQRHAASVARNSDAPPWDGWRTYGAPSARSARGVRRRARADPRRRARRTAAPPRSRRRSGGGSTSGTPGAVRMRRHEVPEQHVVGDPELGERAVHDRRAELGGAGAGQLPFGGERDPRDPRAVVARRLADEDDRRARSPAQVVGEPSPAERRVGVLVVRCADPGRRKGFDERRLHARGSYSDRRGPVGAQHPRLDRGAHRRGAADARLRPLRPEPRPGERLARPGGDPGGGRARRRGSLPLQHRPPEPDPGSAASGARRRTDRVVRRSGAGDRGRPGPDAPQVRGPRRRRRLDRLDELDRRLVHASGERRRDRSLDADRSAVRGELRRAVEDRRRRAERARSSEPRARRGAKGARVVHAGVRRGALDPDREGDRESPATGADLLAGDHRRAGAVDPRPGRVRGRARPRRLRRPAAGARRDPPVASERERRVEAAAARARDDRRLRRQALRSRGARAAACTTSCTRS